MAQKSVTKRFRITKRGKVRRRAMALGHSRGNKSQRQMLRKRQGRGLDGANTAAVKHYLSQA